MPPKSPKLRSSLKHLRETKLDHGLTKSGAEYLPDELDAAILAKTIKAGDKRAEAEISKCTTAPLDVVMNVWSRTLLCLNDERRVDFV